MTPDATKSLAEIKAKLANAAAFGWLETPLAAFDGRTGRELLENGEGERMLRVACLLEADGLS